MQIYLASNQEKSIDFEHHVNIQDAFFNAETEWEQNEGKILDESQYSIAWVRNDGGDWEMWVILYAEVGYKAELSSFIVYTIEVFGE